MVRGLVSSQWCEQANRDLLAEKLCVSVAENLQEAIDSLGEASLVVSGGSTPLPFFQALSLVDLDWAAVKILLADERWVPFDHADSNARFVRENLMINAASKAAYVSLYRDAAEPEMVLAELEECVNQVARPFTVVILGMGEDGHTASLFPETAGLDEALSLNTARDVAIMRPRSVPQVRVSLTRQALLNSRYRYLHITGDKKKQVLESALSAKDPASLPIAAFFEKHVPPIAVYWSA